VDVGLPDCPESCGQCLDVNTTEEFANKKDENGKLNKIFNVIVDKYCRLCFQGSLDWICSGMEPDCLRAAGIAAFLLFTTIAALLAVCYLWKKVMIFIFLFKNKITKCNVYFFFTRRDRLKGSSDLHL
jgi:hypothetical protein